MSSTSSAPATTVATSAQRHAGQQVGGPGPAGVADGVGTDDPVPGPRERRAEHGADPAGADDADGQPGGVLDAVHERATYSYRTDAAAPVRDARAPPGTSRGWVPCGA